MQQSETGRFVMVSVKQYVAFMYKEDVCHQIENMTAQFSVSP